MEWGDLQVHLWTQTVAHSGVGDTLCPNSDPLFPLSCSTAHYKKPGETLGMEMQEFSWILSQIEKKFISSLLSLNEKNFFSYSLSLA